MSNKIIIIFEQISITTSWRHQKGKKNVLVAFLMRQKGRPHSLEVINYAEWLAFVLISLMKIYRPPPLLSLSILTRQRRSM